MMKGFGAGDGPGRRPRQARRDAGRPQGRDGGPFPASMPGADSSLSELLASAPQARGRAPFPGSAPGRLPWRHKGAKGSGKKKKKGGRVTPPSPLSWAARPSAEQSGRLAPRGRGVAQTCENRCRHRVAEDFSHAVAREQWRKELVAVKLRLVRMGKKKQPTYRVVRRTAAPA